jgi:hypothetical protein
MVAFITSVFGSTTTTPVPVAFVVTAGTSWAPVKVAANALLGSATLAVAPAPVDVLPLGVAELPVLEGVPLPPLVETSSSLSPPQDARKSTAVNAIDHRVSDFLPNMFMKISPE